LANERLEGGLVNLLSLVDVDRAARVSVETRVEETLFSWMPSSFIAPIEASRVSPAALFVTGAAALLLSPFVINPVEELYFRGYLLPRMARFGRGAPYLNAALWALGHLWQPWGAPLLFLAMVPAIVVVQRTRCVWLIVVGHALGNFLMILGMVVMGAK
jgi:membrane protease YdiL (CAAX protease family)